MAVSGRLQKTPSENSQIDINVLAQQLKLAVRMTGQSCNQIVHQRRLNILHAMADDKSTAENLIKQNASALTDEKEKLFGESFQKKLARSIKDSKNTQEFFENVKSLKIQKDWE